MNHELNGKPLSNPLGRPTRAIVLGYYDGPTNGVMEFGERGPVFRFAMSDEDEQLASNSSSRIYDLSPLPADAFDRIVDVIREYITPLWPMWCPTWRFPSQQIEDLVTKAVDAVLAEAGPVECQFIPESDRLLEKYEMTHHG